MNSQKIREAREAVDEAEYLQRNRNKYTEMNVSSSTQTLLTIAITRLIEAIEEDD